MKQGMFWYRDAAIGLCVSLMLSQGACETPKSTGAVRPKPPIPAAQTEERAGYTVADSPVWYATTLLALFPEAIPLHGVTYAARELPCVPVDLTSFSGSASTTDIGFGPALVVQGSVSLRPLPPPFRVLDGGMGKRYMLHLQAYLIAPSGRVVWSQEGFPQGGPWVSAEGAQANFTLIDAYSGPTARHTVLIVAAGDPVLSALAKTGVLLGADWLRVHPKPEPKPPEPDPKPPDSNRLRSIRLSDPVLAEFAYKLAVIDNGYLPRGSSQELAIRRQIREVYPKVRESVEQIADMTVVGVQMLEEKGIESNNYKILRAVNLSMTSETRALWPMQYAELAAAVVTLLGG